jgi:hypothetical protein
MHRFLLIEELEFEINFYSNIQRNYIADFFNWFDFDPILTCSIFEYEE